MVMEGKDLDFRRYFGCGFLLFALAFLAYHFFFATRATSELNAAIKSQEMLEERLGKVDEYVPAGSGLVRPSRVEIFVRVRDQVDIPCRTLLGVFSMGYGPDTYMINEKTDAAMRLTLRSMMLKPLGNYLTLRNQALLEENMSLGEYLYIYSLAYFSWLKYSPEDGPYIDQLLKRQKPLFLGDDIFAAATVRRRYHRFVLSTAKRQLASLSPSDRLYRAVRSEVSKLEVDPKRVLWQDGLPANMEESFKPFRRRLVYHYSEATNCFELAPRDREEWQG